MGQTATAGASTAPWDPDMNSLQNFLPMTTTRPSSTGHRSGGDRVKAAEELCSRAQAVCKQGCPLHTHTHGLWHLIINSSLSLPRTPSSFQQVSRSVPAILRQSHSVWLMLLFGKAEHGLEPMAGSSFRISLVRATGRSLHCASKHHGFTLRHRDVMPARTSFPSLCSLLGSSVPTQARLGSNSIRFCSSHFPWT